MSATSTNKNGINGRVFPTPIMPKAETVEPAHDSSESSPGTADGGDESTPATRDGRRTVIRTTTICAAVGAAGHLALLWGWVNRPPESPLNLLPWQPIVGASLTVVAIVAFGGFYLATLRARIALVSTFVLTFLLLLTFVLTVTEINDGAELQMVQALLGDFRAIVQTIIGFYFGTETILSITKIIRAPKDNPAAVRRADRDLPAGAS